MGAKIIRVSMRIKEEMRILGIDDCPFDKKREKFVKVIGIVFRGSKFIDGVLSTKVRIDGLDATQKLVKMINQSSHKPQLKVIMLDGITVGGFNLIDIKELNKKTGLAVIVINRKMPNLKKVKKALLNFSDFEERWKIVKSAGRIKRFLTKRGKFIYYQNVGVDDEDAEKIINLSISRSDIPEPLRVAHLIATGIKLGESRGHA